jgi:hypothetical protein
MTHEKIYAEYIFLSRKQKSIFLGCPPHAVRGKSIIFKNKNSNHAKT